MTTGAFFGVNHLKINAHAPRHGGEVAITFHLGFGIGKTDATISVMVIDRIIRIGSQLAIERDGMTFQPDHGLIHAEIRDLCGRVPGGARCQLVTFNQHNIRPAFTGQMIEGRTARYTATNHHHAGR